MASRASKRETSAASAARSSRSSAPDASGASARALEQGDLAGRRLRRGGQGAARRSGGGGRGGARSRAHPARPQRFQEARRRSAREALRENLRHRAGGGGLRLDRAHRPRQYPARLAVGAGARGQGAAGPAAAGVRRRQRSRSTAAANAQAVVSGDALVASIAAASIVAKVTRDRLMIRLGLAHPGYGFERHMGYSVPEHFAALARLGPTIHHRRSFAPVADKLAALTQELGGGVSDEVDRRVVASLARPSLLLPGRNVPPARANALRLPDHRIPARAPGGGVLDRGADASRRCGR